MTSTNQLAKPGKPTYQTPLLLQPVHAVGDVGYTLIADLTNLVTGRVFTDKEQITGEHLKAGVRATTDFITGYGFNYDRALTTEKQINLVDNQSNLYKLVNTTAEVGSYFIPSTGIIKARKGARMIYGAMKDQLAQQISKTAPPVLKDKPIKPYSALTPIQP